MIRGVRTRRLAAWIAPGIALAWLAIGPTSAVAAASPVTRTFSLVASPNSRTRTLVNIDSLLVNARCSASGAPVIYAFTSSSNSDLFGRFYDGLGRLHIVKDSSFSKLGKGVRLTPSTGDFDATGTVMFETYSGKVVTVEYAFDNSTTLGKRDVCTVYGSAIAS